MENPEILPLIVIVIGVLFSSLKKKPKQTLPPAVPQPKPQPPLGMPIPDVETEVSDNSPAKSAGTEIPPIPKIATAAPKLPTIPKTPKMPTADSIAADDAYSSIPHPDVPVGKDWRRAIIAHEILKRKF